MIIYYVSNIDNSNTPILHILKLYLKIWNISFCCNSTTGDVRFRQGELAGCVELCEYFHNSTIELSQVVRRKYKLYNYVTPASYLELNRYESVLSIHDIINFIIIIFQEILCIRIFNILMSFQYVQDSIKNTPREGREHKKDVRGFTSEVKRSRKSGKLHLNTMFYACT